MHEAVDSLVHAVDGRDRAADTVDVVAASCGCLHAQEAGDHDCQG